jgi:hypothetical protein
MFEQNVDFKLQIAFVWWDLWFLSSIFLYKIWNLKFRFTHQTTIYNIDIKLIKPIVFVWICIIGISSYMQINKEEEGRAHVWNFYNT